MINFPIPTAVGEQFEDPASGNSWEWDGIGWIGGGSGGARFVPQTDPAGAAIMPAGGDAVRPPASVGGYTRWNPDRGYLEVFTGGVAGWNQLDYVPSPAVLPADYTFTTGTYSGPIVCNNCVIPAGVTVTIDGILSIRAEGNVQIDGSVQGVGTGPAGGQPYQTFCGTWANGGAPNMAGFPGSGPCPGSSIAGGLRSNVLSSLMGSGGSSGFGANNGATPGLQISSICGGGGAGASFICKAAGSILNNGNIGCIGTTPVIDRGQYATASGGGGGSGGVVILDAVKDCTNNGLIVCAGANGEGAHIQGGGGGGGGGGIIIVQSRVGTAFLGSYQVQAGVAGAGTGGGAGGGGGGGCGGRGGSSDAPGQAGTAATFGSPL